MLKKDSKTIKTEERVGVTFKTTAEKKRRKLIFFKERNPYRYTRSQLVFTIFEAMNDYDYCVMGGGVSF